MMPGGNMVGWIFMLVFWGLIIVGIVLGVRWLGHQERTGASPEVADPPLETLKRRYARGEISKEEFNRIKKDVVSSGSQAAK